MRQVLFRLSRVQGHGKGLGTAAVRWTDWGYVDCHSEQGLYNGRVLHTFRWMQRSVPHEDQYTKGAGIYKMGKHASPSIITNQIAVYWWRVHPLTYILLLDGSRNQVA